MRGRSRSGFRQQRARDQRAITLTLSTTGNANTSKASLNSLYTYVIVAAMLGEGGEVSDRGRGACAPNLGRPVVMVQAEIATRSRELINLARPCRREISSRSREISSRSRRDLVAISGLHPPITASRRHGAGAAPRAARETEMRSQPRRCDLTPDMRSHTGDAICISSRAAGRGSSFSRLGS